MKFQNKFLSQYLPLLAVLLISNPGITIAGGADSFLAPVKAGKGILHIFDGFEKKLKQAAVERHNFLSNSNFFIDELFGTGTEVHACVTRIKRGWNCSRTSAKKEGEYIVELYQKRKIVENVGAYKISVKSNEITSIDPATMQESLLAFETNFLTLINLSPREVNKATCEKWDSQATRLFYFLVRGLKNNTPEAISNFQIYLQTVKAGEAPITSAYLKLTKDLMDRFKYDLTVCINLGKPPEVIAMVKSYFEQAENLYKWLNAQPKLVLNEPSGKWMLVKKVGN